MADVFTCSFNVFMQELSRHGRKPDCEMLTSLVFAVDADAMFDLGINDVIIIVFSDDSKTVIHPHTMH
jgi:hypothetical protein